ncbi:MAG: hypothetical protein ABI147_12000 [Acidobacteriaceae bacterium]
MAESAQAGLVRAVQVARDCEERRSANGLRFATFGETGVTAPDLQSMIEAVPPAITAALKGNTYFFVPLALREAAATEAAPQSSPDHAMVASAYSAEFDDEAICHRNVALGTGHQGVFISTRLMGDRFALCFEFFINIAHAFVDETGVPESFANLVWDQATGGIRGSLGVVRGETSMDAWESRNLALGRPMQDEGVTSARIAPSRRGRNFASMSASGETAENKIDDKERGLFVSAAFSDALAIYLLSLAVDFDYSELREREYPLLAPAALAARLRMMAELFPPNTGYEFSVRYRRRA